MPNHGPRQQFADRLSLLFADAGKPVYDQLVRDAQRIVPRDEFGRTPRVSKQRISDWKAGKQVPREFGTVAAVLSVLITQARNRKSAPAVDGLYSLHSWKALWEQAAASPASPAGQTFVLGQISAPGTELNSNTGLNSNTELICPYRGLAAFEAEHADYFFGRAVSTQGLVDRVNRLTATGGLLMIAAPSGAGKTSLLGAGLVPAIRADHLTSAGSAHWPSLLLTPGNDPFATLRKHIPELAGTSLTHAEPEQCPANSYLDRAPLGDPIRTAIKKYAERHAGPGARLVLIVDQFEELFTLCDNERQREEFIETLHAVSQTAGQVAPALVIIGMRADFYSRCLRYPALVEALQYRHMVLPPMTVKELTEAITGPASKVGLRLEKNLAELLIQDAGIRNSERTRDAPTSEMGILPLLSHTLRATWQHRQGSSLTIAGYKATGGIQGAVTQTAERTLARLDVAGQRAAMSLLLRLTRVGEDHTQDTRRRCHIPQLLHQTADSARTADALEAFVQARLVSVDTDTAQVSHEALLHSWPRLRKQIDQHRGDLLQLQRIEEDAADWDRRQRDRALLYQGARLEAVERWADPTDPDAPSDVARAFLAMSARQNRRRRSIARGGIVAVIASAALALVFAVQAGSAAVTARIERDNANFADIVAQADRREDTNRSLAAQLDLVAHQTRPADQSVIGRLLSKQNAPLATPLAGDTGAVYCTSFSPDGKTLATASFEHAVRLWDLSNPAQPTPLPGPLPVGDGWVSAAVFSPDGHTLATTGQDGAVRLWDVSDPRHPQELGPALHGNNGSSSWLRFSPDGKVLATANDDATVRLWNVADPRRPTPLGPPLRGQTAVVRTVAFSPDGRVLAAGGDDTTVSLWDVRNPAQPVPIGTLRGHVGPVHSVAFSPDGRVLATGGDDAIVRLWDVADPSRAAPLSGPLFAHQAPVWSVEFSPDGRTLASGSQDGTARLWNVTNPSGAKLVGGSLSTTTGGILAIGFSPDGRTLAAGGHEGVTMLWSLPATVLVDDISRIFGIAFSPDGRHLATGFSDHTARLWDVAQPSRPRLLGPAHIGRNGYAKDSFAFRPDGRLLAAQIGGQPVRLFDVADPAQPRLASHVEQNTQYADAVAFSPDGQVLATGDTDTSVQLWDVTDPTRPQRLGGPLRGHEGSVNSIAYHGRTLATAGSDGTIRLWDVTDPRRATALGQPLDPDAVGQISQVVFSPDGKVLAATGDDKTVWLWDVSDPARPAALGRLVGHTQPVITVAFSPDGTKLASGSTDQTVRLWNVTDPRHPSGGSTVLTGHTGPVNTVVFSPDGQTLASSSADNTVLLWDLNVDHAIQRVCATTKGVLTPNEWQQILPQLTYNPPCP